MVNFADGFFSAINNKNQHKKIRKTHQYLNIRMHILISLR